MTSSGTWRACSSSPIVSRRSSASRACSTRIFDGLSALVSAPETAPQIASIVAGSVVKGIIAGLLIG